jgi:hypothetical protein
MSRSKKTNIAVFLNEDGKIRQLPAPARARRLILAYLADKFTAGKTYSEKEVNARIDAWHTFGDYFILRRLLVDGGFMGRKTDGSVYWRLQAPIERGEKEIGEEKRVKTAL